MGLRSWWYGDILQSREGQTDLWLPGLTLNVDDLRDFDAKLTEYSPVLRIDAYNEEAQVARHPADIAALLSMPAYDREHFDFVAMHEEQGSGNYRAIIGFQRATASYVRITDPDFEPLVREAIKVLGYEAKWRTPSKRLVEVGRLLAFLVVAGLYGAICWLSWTWKMAPLLILVGLLTVWAYRPIDGWLSEKLSARFQRQNGVRIELVSRAQREERRWNRKRDWKVGVPTTVAGGLVVYLLTFWLK